MPLTMEFTSFSGCTQEVTTPMANFSAIRNPEAGLGGNVLQEGCRNSVLMAVSGTVAAAAPG